MSEELTAEKQALLDELAALVAPQKEVKQGRIVTLYSDGGVGKTSTCCQSRNGVLVEAKDYSSDVLKSTGAIRKDFPVIRTTDYYGCVEVLQKLAKAAVYNPVVIDGGSGLSDWSDEIAIEQDFESSRSKFTAFGGVSGDRSAAMIFSPFIEALNELKFAGIWVYVLCHRTTQKVKNPQGSDWIRSIPALSPYKLAMLEKFSDQVMLMDLITAQDNVNKLTNVGKSKGGSQRILYSGSSGAYMSKNRLDLPDEIILGGSPAEAYKNFTEAVSAAMTK